MHKERIELQEGMSVEIVEGKGDLSIRGVDEAILVVASAKEGVAIQQEEGKVVLRLPADAHLKVWKNAPVTVRQLDGDIRGRGLVAPLKASDIRGDVVLNNLGEVSLANVEGDVTISRAGAVRAQGYLDDDVVLRGVGAVELAEVGGDLTVREAESLAAERLGDDVSASVIAGQVRLENVQGDSILRDVGGAAKMGRVRGDLVARNLRGDLEVPRVDGDVSLYIAFQEERRYNLASQHKITVRFPEGTAARFHIQAPRWTYPSDDAFTVEKKEEGRAVVRLGEGGPDVYLTSDDEVVLGALAGDWERSWQDYGRRMEAWGEEFGRRMEAWGEEMRTRFQEVDWERIGQEVEEATSRVAQIVETRLQEIDLDEIEQRAREAAEKVKEVDWDRIGRKVERAVQHSVSRAQAGLQKLQERLRRRGVDLEVEEAAREVAEVELKAEEPALAVDVELVAEKPAAAAPEPAAPAAPAEPAPVGLAEDEERQAVLRLLEEGRLTADEAAALLDALEGY